MALHPIELPPESRDLRRIVALLRLLLRALVKLPPGSHTINEVWLQGVWKGQSHDWIKRFCRKRKYSVLDPIEDIGNSSPVFRKALLYEFCRQNRLRRVWSKGGVFKELAMLPESTPALVKSVRQLMDRFYGFLGSESQCNWNGYEFARGRSVRRDTYGACFEEANKVRVRVCPYCDGPNDLPELDHYYAKSGFPLIAVSPWNLIPVCHKCNDTTRGGKGNTPALTPGTVKPAEEWLHPFFRPAGGTMSVSLSGSPCDASPHLYSDDACEHRRLQNHETLIPNLPRRWTIAASDYFDTLVNRVREEVAENGGDVNFWVKKYLRDQRRGLEPMALARAAVCQAVLAGRPEYLSEFEDPNPIRMS